MEVIENLSKIVNEHFPKLLEITSAEFEVKTKPGKWSKKEILGHLIDSAFNNYRRFLKSNSQSNLIFDGYNQDESVILHRYQERDIVELCRIWKSINVQIFELLKGMSEELLTKENTEHNFDQICMRPCDAAKSYSLAYLIDDYNFHMIHHLNQILNKTS